MKKGKNNKSIKNQNLLLKHDFYLFFIFSFFFLFSLLIFFFKNVNSYSINKLLYSHVQISRHKKAMGVGRYEREDQK